MRLLIRPLILRLRPVFSLYLRPRRWIFDAFEVNDKSRRMTKTPGALKKISLLRILLLMGHQVGPNPHRHSLRKTRIVVFTKKNLDNKAKARILLLLASMPLLSGRTKTRIRTRKTYPTLNAILVSRKVIMRTCVPKKSQKTSVTLNKLHISDWG